MTSSIPIFNPESKPVTDQPNCPVKFELLLKYGRVLQAVREAAGLTRQELEAKCGIPASSIGRFETARNWPSLLDVTLILAATEFTFADFNVLIQKVDGQAFEMDELLKAKKRQLSLLRASIVLETQHIKELEALAETKPGEVKQ